MNEKNIKNGKVVITYKYTDADGVSMTQEIPYFLEDGTKNPKAIDILTENKKEEINKSVNDEEITTKEDVVVPVVTNIGTSEIEGVTNLKQYSTKKKKGKKVLIAIAGTLVAIGLMVGIKSTSAKPLNYHVDDEPIRQEQTIENNVKEEVKEELKQIETVSYEQFIDIVNYVKDEINNHGTNKVEDNEISSYVFIANVERMDDDTKQRIISEKLISDSAENVLQDSFQTTDAINSIIINATYGGTGHYFDYSKVFVAEKDKEIATWYTENLKNARGENAASIVSKYYAMLNNDRDNTDAPYVNNEINAGVYYLLNSSAGIMTLEGASSTGAIGYDVYDNFEKTTDMFETSNVLQTLDANCFGTFNR